MGSWLYILLVLSPLPVPQNPSIKYGNNGIPRYIYTPWVGKQSAGPTNVGVSDCLSRQLGEGGDYVKV